jgi:hypothetical protein
VSFYNHSDLIGKYILESHFYNKKDEVVTRYGRSVDKSFTKGKWCQILERLPVRAQFAFNYSDDVCATAGSPICDPLPAGERADQIMICGGIDSIQGGLKAYLAQERGGSMTPKLDKALI